MSSSPPALVAVRAESRRFVPPLLFLPGLWTDAAVWRAPMSLLAQRGWDCFALQLPPCPPAWPDWRQRVAAAASALADPPVVIGHDAGALLALAMSAGVVARVGLAPFPARAYCPGGAVGLPRWRVRWAAWRGAALARPATLARVDVIASHGHTIFHGPPGAGERFPSTWQIGEPAVIAALTGIPTVADFRPADVAAGGQGAPLAPYAHAKLFHSAGIARAVLNLGGIANVTYLPRNGRTTDVVAFDVGPANMVIDACAAAASDGKLRFDRDGRLARRGQADAAILETLARHPFLRRKPPKSTGREEFGAPFLAELMRLADASGLSPADRVATATAFTALAVADAYRRFLEPLGGVDETVLCGGGAHNPALVEALRQALGGQPLRLVDELGVSTDALEAVAFAVLGVEAVRGRPANLPAVTGASRAMVLGKIVPGDELHFRRLLRKARPARA